MIIRILINLILKWYIKKTHIINKIPVEEELDAYSFKSKDRVEKILKYEMTNLTLKYFEAHGDKDTQAIFKGQALAYQMLLDRHRKAKLITDKELSIEKKVKMWNNYKFNSWNGNQPK